MSDITLVIMAAGLGSRFGEGIKQLAPVGPGGEIIMDYSIHDALAAGFDRVVFIIRKDLEKDFKEVIGYRMEQHIPVYYAFQELDDLPEGFEIPNGRKKPWGTGHAVLSCKDIIDGPFVVINADDYYGKEAFVKLHDFLQQEEVQDGRHHFAMAGFILKNTLSENGGVTRGICTADENGYITSIQETHQIVKTKAGAGVLGLNGSIRELDVDCHVSMNMWAFTAPILDHLEEAFVEFLKEIEPGDVKAEFLLPTIVNQMLVQGTADVKLLETGDRWFGVTYQEDRETVREAFLELVEKGVYPAKLL